ncbi:MAG TPA: aminoacyl-tRNA hydrolase [Herbinix luporum]|jgi:PTH1 family peptidyl-tRNA hydrolase|uniref:Peptidyl-tRNA hydrolase n=1 Tax=Herbinix luporum TaxID=1679721 RepID=A0A0K8J8L3_9FIRM|nr:aminoacyl-tRNA hydrolase [Herbinix luporum]CUH93814.1 Peptidyl-tRNA hydrolase [Herbinix luporum]HHT57588.1 aminoacyl-tRNA hydrolase [Herbinix luporum]
MRIIIGLGNPTEKYQATRHNIGWDAITRIADDYNIALNQNKHKAICGTGYIEGEKVILAQPVTYMNLSGESVRQLVDYYKVSAQDIIVIYDDISLDVGQLRIRKKGSAGGHNGIKSIISHLGTDEFPRIKIGVGEKPKDWDLADYVLSRFKEDEEKIIREALKDSSDACRMIISDGMDAAMNKYNKKKEAKKTNNNKSQADTIKDDKGRSSLIERIFNKKES